MLGQGELGDPVPVVCRERLFRGQRANFRARNDALALFLYSLTYFISVRFFRTPRMHFKIHQDVAARLATPNAPRSRPLRTISAGARGARRYVDDIPGYWVA